MSLLYSSDTHSPKGSCIFHGVPLKSIEKLVYTQQLFSTFQFLNLRFAGAAFLCYSNSLLLFIQDNSGIATTDSHVGVFGAELKIGHYKLTFYEAERLCEILGAILVSYNKLYKAWEAGMEWCRFVCRNACVSFL